MKSPYDDRLSVEDIAELRGTSQQYVRIIAGKLGIKPAEFIGRHGYAIYSAEDSKRLCEHGNLPGQQGRPAVLSVHDIIVLAANTQRKTVCQLLGITKDSGNTFTTVHSAYDRIESLLIAKWPTLKRKLREVAYRTAEGRLSSRLDYRPAWPAARKAEFVEFVLTLLQS